MAKPEKYNFHFDNKFGQNPIHTHYFDLHQVGDFFLSPGARVSEHEQYCFEITFVAQGNGIISVNDRQYAVKKNDLQFSFLHESHALQADETVPFRFFYLALTPLPNTICETILDFLAQYSAQNGCTFSFPDIFDCVKRLLVEFYNKGVFFEKRVEALVMDILISIYREIAGIKAERRLESPMQKDVIIYNVVNYIFSTDKLVTLKDISNKFFYDYTYISRNFKNYMHVSLREYLYDIRFEKARRLLESTDKSITEISELTGYSCIHSFSRSFKQKCGLSPEKYRAECRQNL